MSDTTNQGPSQALYFVREDGSRWTVSHSGAEYPYQTRDMAIGAAVDAANTSGKRGHDARVHIRGDGQEWQIVWRYGLDPYPPTW
ncbi:MAG: hypothetical protein ABIO86_09930 [Sphingomonas sp.]